MNVIDGKYVVHGLCSDSGGMGTLHFVTAVNTDNPVLVLKLCKLSDPEMLARFKREVRVMEQLFQGNSYVMQVLDANLDHDPPYFVMPYFEHGDLMTIAPSVRGDMAKLEMVFNRMIDCIAQLHDRHVLHRDIKPQNFLLHNSSMVVSDLGLCTEQESATVFTRSSMWAGTPGYLPPEYMNGGGFKDADVTTDIFMLGKSFYVMLTGRDPMYLLADGLPPQLFPFLERCCATSKPSRYPNLASLKQSLTSAFDVILGRAVGPGKAHALIRSISDRLKTSNQYIPDEIIEFIDQMAILDQEDQYQVCMELPEQAFSLLSQAPVQHRLSQFLGVYHGMVENATYPWSFAEDIADNMKVLVEGRDVLAADKAEALRVAIIGAIRQNRFAAMDTCRGMIQSIEDDELAQRVHDVLLQHPHYFLEHIDPTACKAAAIRAAIALLKTQNEQPSA